MMKTERLLIRNFTQDDAETCFQSWGQDKELGKYIISYPMKDIQQMRNYVAELSENENAWIITDKKRNTVIGYITLDIPYEQLGIGEIGYIVGAKYQHQGYAFEAINCVMKEYFINKNMYMIEAKYNETNIASSKLLEKTGFQVDGKLRDRRIDFTTGERSNLIVCSMTRQEFMKFSTV